MYIRTAIGSAVILAALAAVSLSAQQPAQPAPPSAPQPTATGQTQPTPQPTGTIQPGASQQPAGTAGTQAPVIGGVQPGTAGQPVAGTQIPGPMTAACAQADASTALPLLDRIQRLLDQSIKNQFGKVSIERSAIDEMRAEVAQIRTAIQPVKR